MYGNNLKAVMDKNKVGVTELALKLGTTPQQVSRWRNSTDLKMSVVVNLCNALCISIEEFIDASEVDY